GPASAILALDAALGEEIGALRTGNKADYPVICDVAYAGLQVIRLYMMAYRGNDTFREERTNSGLRVNNALNGSFYKYGTKDGRFFSAHVYYESQKKKMMDALDIRKSADDFTMETLKADKATVAAAMKRYNGVELEELAFSSGACGCMLRSRDEWEKTPVGKAVCNMPLFRLEKVAKKPVKKYGSDTSRGPLTGVKVLDLTHIIAGPACSRILAEQGADVLLVRRGKFEIQEQAMLELDGWAGKNSIQLDFNNAADLARAKQLVKEADVVISSYQYGALDRFGLSHANIHKLNPNVINASMSCFSDTVWHERPGWAPLAEDITGLSVRNGSAEKPKNLNGVPLDYIPGFILACGVLQALKRSMTEGGSFNVFASLTRAGYWLHECTDICEKDQTGNHASSVAEGRNFPLWKNVWQTVEGTAAGTVKFPSPATYRADQHDAAANMFFTDGNTGWQTAKTAAKKDVKTAVKKAAKKAVKKVKAAAKKSKPRK
ncbi:MAG: CoA transferase, partial [Spirochaetota bacterium]